MGDVKKTTKYGYARETDLSYEDAVVKVTETLKEQGFGILTEIDVKATLKTKLDKDLTKYIILGACNPNLALRPLSGEIDIALTNHYYLFRFLEGTSNEIPVRNYSPRGGGPGALVNIAGAGIVDTSPHLDTAERFIEYLLSEEAQSYFATETFEYPLADGVATHSLITPLSEIQTPDIDLSELDDLEGTLALLEEVGAL